MTIIQRALAFATQGAGRAMWPLAASLARMAVAAGGGWIAITAFGAGMTGLAAMVLAATLCYAVICATAMLVPSVWRPEKR